jgi:hypothetical protein
MAALVLICPHALYISTTTRSMTWLSKTRIDGAAETRVAAEAPLARPPTQQCDVPLQAFLHLIDQLWTKFGLSVIHGVAREVEETTENMCTAHTKPSPQLINTVPATGHRRPCLAMWIPVTDKNVALAGMKGSGVINFSNFIIRFVNFRNFCLSGKRGGKGVEKHSTDSILCFLPPPTA